MEVSAMTYQTGEASPVPALWDSLVHAVLKVGELIREQDHHLKTVSFACQLVVQICHYKFAIFIMYLPFTSYSP